MSDNRPKPFGSAFSRVGQIYLVVQAGAGYIVLIPVLFQISVHKGDGRGLTVIRAQVHHLNAQTLADGQKLRRSAVQALLSPRLRLCPFQVRRGDKIGKANGGDPAKAGLVRIVDVGAVLLPPKPLQRRNDVFKKALYRMVALIILMVYAAA